MPSHHLILCHPFFLLPSIFPIIRIFPNESVLYTRWPDFWSFSFNISLSNEYSGLISFRLDGFDLLQSKGLSRVLSSTTVQIISSSVLSFLYSPTLTSIYDSWKTIALTRWTFVGKVMSLLFNMLSRLIIALILRNYSKEARWVACIYEFGYGIHALKHISQ